MPNSVKVAVSLPEELLERVDELVAARGYPRSRLFRQALEELLRREAERQDIERYVAAYRDQPEQLDEIEAAMKSGVAAISQEPWP